MTVQTLQELNSIGIANGMIFNADSTMHADYFYDPRWENGKTWYVDSNVSKSGDGKSKATAFKTLKEATDIASDWDTVHICACTLSITSGITTSKNLKIEGEGRDMTIVKGSGTSTSNGYFIRFDASNSDARLELRSMTIRDFVCSSYFVQGYCGPALCCNKKAATDVGNFKTRQDLESAYYCFMLDCSVISCKSSGSNNYYEGGSIANVAAMCTVFDHSSSHNGGTMKNSTCINCIVREAFGNHNTVEHDSALYGCTVYNCQRGASNSSLTDSFSVTLRNCIVCQDSSFPQASITVKGLSHCAMYGNYTYVSGKPDASDFILAKSPFANTSTLQLTQDATIRGKADPEFIWLERDVWGNTFTKNNAAIGAVQS